MKKFKKFDSASENAIAEEMSPKRKPSLFLKNSNPPPPLTDEILAAATAELGFVLPKAFVDVRKIFFFFFFFFF